MSKVESENKNATRARILEVAERLFAEQGFEAVSLRAITEEAKANVAAVNYHFNSKFGLIEEVILLHVVPINQGRRENLEKLLQSGELSVRNVLRAFFLPFVEHISASEQCQHLLMKFMGRVSDSRFQERMPEKMVPELQEVIGRYVKALQECLPQLSEADIWKRLHFTFGVFVNTMLQSDMLAQLAGDKVGDVGIKSLLDDAIDFCAAGFESVFEK